MLRGRTPSGTTTVADLVRRDAVRVRNPISSAAVAVGIYTRRGMTVYDIFYEGPNGEVWNRHDAANDSDHAADIAADLIREGSPWVQVEIRRSSSEIAAMLERRKARDGN